MAIPLLLLLSGLIDMGVLFEKQVAAVTHPCIRLL
jgi:hypothetical protein